MCFIMCILEYFDNGWWTCNTLYKLTHHKRSAVKNREHLTISDEKWSYRLGRNGHVSYNREHLVMWLILEVKGDG